MSAVPSPARILIFRTGQLGDTVTALPAIRAIREGLPGARLFLLSERSAAETPSPWEALYGRGTFERVIPYVPAKGRGRRLRRLAALALELRRLRPDTLVYLAPYPRTLRQVERDRLFFRAAGIRRCYGMKPTLPEFGTREVSGRLVRRPSERSRLLEIVRELGLPRKRHDSQGVQLPVLEQHRLTAEARWHEAGWNAETPVVAIAPGSNMPAKRWPAERFAAVGATLLGSRPDLRIALVGGDAERDLCATMAQTLGDRAVTFAGRTSVLESAELLRRCALYVGNDTGAMHLASSVGTPCIALFSARDHPGVWEPSGCGDQALRHEVPCSGCLLEVCEMQRMQCLTRISVADVVEAAQRTLNARADLVCAE